MSVASTGAEQTAKAEAAPQFHPAFASAAGPGTVILETKDDTLFYARLPLLAELSSVFRDMQQIGAAGHSDQDAKDNKEEYPRIPLPAATKAGLELVLTIVRNTIEGKQLKQVTAPDQSYPDALEIANAYDLPMVRAAIPAMAKTAYAESPFGYLAFLLICGDGGVDEQARLAVKRAFAPEMPIWARDAIRRHDPDYFAQLLEVQLRLYASCCAIVTTVRE